MRVESSTTERDVPPHFRFKWIVACLSDLAPVGNGYPAAHVVCQNLVTVVLLSTSAATILAVISP